jgi:trehalose 6-phosphate phosphatase
MLAQGNVDEFLKTVAKAPKSVLLLDYDGTLAPFTLNRTRALPYPGVTDLLQKIIDAGRTRLVIVTGRDAREIEPFLRLKPTPEVWGSHGLQRLRTDGSCEMPNIPEDVEKVLGYARRWLDYHGFGHLAETKPGSIAVHWRALDRYDAEELRGKILMGWFPIADRASLKLLEFDGGVEMRMADLDKGDAIRTVLDEMGPDAPAAYLGDDLTDEKAFRALGSRGLGVLVRTKLRRSAAKAWLKPPVELLSFLLRWLIATETTQLARSATYR